MTRFAPTAAQYRSDVRRRAWAIMREVYSYPGISIASCGWHCVRSAIRIAAQEIEHGTDAERLERAAQSVASRHNYDTAALTFQLNRYSGGSLSLNWEAAHARDVYGRALTIAIARRDAANELQADAA